MIGYAYVSSFPYYDMQTRQMRFKNRPVLVIGRTAKTMLFCQYHA